MKYKFLILLVILLGFSFSRFSRDNIKTTISNTECKKALGKCKKSVKPINDDTDIFQLSPLNHFMTI